MTPLERALRERIGAEGPISVEAYMEACNAYYYATRDPLGRRGDFTTAPEISQMFGEMRRRCLADCWKRAGAPADAIYAELGPGGGTLAGDALRVMRAAGFAGEVHLVETSPVLRDRQEEAVPDAQWHQAIESFRRGRCCSSPTNSSTRCRSASTSAASSAASSSRRRASRSTVTERSSNSRRRATQAVAAIAGQLAARAAAAIIVDYGQERTSPGDTLQAVRGHRFATVLADPASRI